MVSRENKVLLGFIGVAIILTYGGFWLTDLSSSVLIGVLILVGTVAPLVVNNYLDSRESS